MALGGKKKIIIISSAGILVIIAIVIAFMTGYLSVQVRVGKNAIGTQATVCGDAVVEKFNAINRKTVKNENEFLARQKEIAANAAEVVKIDHSSSDSTCVYIMLAGALAGGDAAKSQEYLNKLTELVDGGQYVDNRVDGVMGMSSLSSKVEALKGKTTNDASSERGDG